MVLVSAILFGLMPYFAVNIYQENIDVTNLLIYRYSFAFLFMLIYCFLKKINIKINKKQLALLSLAAFVGTGLTTYTLFYSYSLIPTGLASCLHFIYPMFTIILARIIHKENLNKKKYLALTLSIIGISLLSVNKEKISNPMGIFWALLSGFTYAIYIVSMANKELKKLSPFCIVFWIFGLTAGFFIAFGIYSENICFEINLRATVFLLNLSFWSTFTAVILFYIGMKSIGPSSASLLSTFEPLTGVFLGVIIFNEDINVKSCLAIFFIILSVLVLSVKINKKHILSKFR